MMDIKQYRTALTAKVGELKAAGKSPPVIERWGGDQMSEQWKHWLRYWTAIGAKGTLAIVQDRQTWTVPAEYPWLFDPSYVP